MGFVKGDDPLSHWPQGKDLDLSVCLSVQTGLVLRRGQRASAEQTLPRLLGILGTPDPLPGPVWACGGRAGSWGQGLAGLLW